MGDVKIRRWTGAFGVATGLLSLVVAGLYIAAGTSPRAEDAAKFTDYVSMHTSLLLTFTLLYPLTAACFLVFLAGLRHLIRQSKQDYEWVSVLVFAAGMVYVILGLFGITLIGGAVLDTVNNKPDPTVVSALGEASTPAFGAIGLIMLALFLASAGYATLGTGVLPRWMAWVAYVGAILSVIAAPSIYAGSGPTGFYTADGYVLDLGYLTYVIWLFVAAIYMMVGIQPAAR